MLTKPQLKSHLLSQKQIIQSVREHAADPEIAEILKEMAELQSQPLPAPPPVDPELAALRKQQEEIAAKIKSKGG